MDVSGRTFFAQYGEILNKCNVTSRPTVEEAMKRIIKQTKKYIHTMYAKDLHLALVKRKVPTTTVHCLAKRMYVSAKGHQRKIRTSPK